MTAPNPIRIYHFTHVGNLEAIIKHGLRSDAACRRDGLTSVEIGSSDIRERRLARPLRGVGAGGFVGDYVPWYFAPRSPMMYALNQNRYEYKDGFDQVVYLVSSVPRVVASGLHWVASDRNAALALAEFTAEEADLPEHISWDVIAARYWRDFLDGTDLRAAEFLVHDTAPWEVVEGIVTKTERTQRDVLAMLEGCSHSPAVSVRAQWYF